MRLHPALIIGLLVLAVPRVARAQEDFEHTIDTVRQLLESQDYEGAIERLGRLKPLVQDVDQRGIVSLYEGLVLSTLGRRTQDRAHAAFKSALLLDPQARLPVKVSRRLERTFEEVRARVLKELAERPPTPRDNAPPPDPAPPAELTPPPPAEPEGGPVGAPAELDAADRLRLPSKWPVLAAPASADLIPVAETFRNKASRPRVLVPAITGGALLATGGVFWGLARRELSQMRKENLSDGALEGAQLAMQRGKRYQHLGNQPGGSEQHSVGHRDSPLYVLQAPKAPMSPGPSAAGTSAFLQGTWS
jgi:hypothetical protein